MLTMQENCFDLMFDTYTVGGLTIALGDCLSVLDGVATASVDSVVTDPPYGMNLQPQRGLTKAIAGDGAAEAKALWAAVLPELYRVAKPDTAHLFFTRWSEPWVKPLLEEFFTVKGCVAWVKNNFGIGYYLRPQWEMAFYCHKGKPPKPEKALSDVWQFPKVHRPAHSCEKPVALMEHAVKFCAPEGGLVLDPFQGVGSTGVACANANRRFIGIELDPGYYEITRGRLDEAVSKSVLDLV